MRDGGGLGEQRLIGRDSELRRMESAFAAVEAGRGSLLVVSGEAGVGKTRFCEEVAATARDRAMSVATGRCWVDGGAPGLWPWQPILRELGGREAADLLDSDTGQSGVDSERFARFNAVADYLAQAASQNPTCIIIDDIQAADAGTVLLTRFLARSLHDLPLVVLLARRLGEDSPATDDGAAARLLGCVEAEAVPLPLKSFNLAETKEFLACNGLADLDADLMGAIARITGGNPLFLRRIAALGPPQEGAALPSGVQIAIRQALDRTGPSSRQVLCASAVLGMSPSIIEVIAISPCDRAAVLDALDQGRREGLVTPEGPDRFSFTHEVVRSVLEQTLSTAEWMDVHAVAAEVVADEGQGFPTERLARRARHSLAAAPRSGRDATQAVEICRAAADEMMASFAYEQADELLSAAVRLHEQASLGPVPAELLVDWAKAAVECGCMTDARARFDRAVSAAQQQGAAVALAESALGLGGYWVNDHHNVTERNRVLGLQNAALDQLPPREVGLKARLEVRLAAEAVCDGAPLEPVKEALARARSCDDPIVRAEAASLAHHVLLSPESLEYCLALAEEQVRVSSKAGLGMLTLMGLCWRAADLFLLGDPAALRALEDLRERANALGNSNMMYMVGSMDVMLLIRAGRLEEAEREAERVYLLGLEAGENDAVGYYGAQLLTIRWLQCRETELLDMAEAVAVSPMATQPHFPGRAFCASLAARAGEVERARMWLQPLTCEGLAALPRSSTWLISMLGIVDAAVWLGDVALAREGYDLLRPYAHLPIMASLAMTCMGSCERTLAHASQTFDDVDLAIEHFERALEANIRLGHRPLVTLARAGLALALRQRGRASDLSHSTELLAEATHEAEAMGMDAHVDRWRSVLSSATRVSRWGHLCQRGEGWFVELEGETSQLGDLVGMRYLVELLTHPGREIPALALASGGSFEVSGARQAVLDDDARLAYTERLRSLRDELEQTRSAGDRDEVERLEAELDMVTDELETAAGLFGRTRAFSDNAERARTAVRKAIMRAIDAIESESPGIAELFRGSIKTGVTCCYRPGETNVKWSTQCPDRHYT